MNRTQTRISRALVGLLALILVIAGATYLGKSKPKPQQKPDLQAKASDKPAAPPVLQVVQTTQPATAPTLQTAMSAVPPTAITVTPSIPAPVLPTVAPAPTTQPQVAAVIKPAPTASPAVTPTVAPAVLASATVPASDKPPTWTPTAAAVPAAPPSDFLNVATAKVSSGDVLGARRLLNDALLSGKLNDTDTAAARKQLADVNETIIFSPRRFDDDDYGGTHIVTERTLTKVADKYDVPWELIAKINNLSDPRKMRAGQKLKIVKGPFNIVVHKKSFTMDLYLGSTPGQPGSLYVKSYPVGLGRDDSTPLGTWMVDSGHKTKDPVYYSPRGEGVIAANDPKNPLGHRWIGLTGVDGSAVGQQSYGIHGTIDPDSIGKQASMGCIRMHNEDVEQVFDMVSEGKTTVIVKD